MDFVVSEKWAKEEFKNVEVWDRRCIPSIISMARAVYKGKSHSFSSSCGPILRQYGSRIFSNNKMSPERMLAGHIKETAKRSGHEAVVLCTQDTTSFNYSNHNATTGLGNVGTGPLSKGIYMHTALVLNKDGLPLGIIGQKQWVRPESERGKRHKRKSLPIEEKESYKWIDGLDWVIQRLPKKIKEVWLISDRESDVYDYISKERPSNVHLLIRATQPRIIEAEIEGKMEIGNLTDIVNKLPEAAKREVEITRDNRTKKIMLSVSYSNIKIYPPTKKIKSFKPLNMTVIYVVETSKENKQDRLEWVLLCDIQDFQREEVLMVIDYYTQRWKVERFHYTLKTGVFNVEKLQFDDAHTLMNALSFYGILAWRVLMITYIGRMEPETSAANVVDSTEIEVLEAFTGKKIETALQATLAIGVVGGFTGGSKRYPYPGIKVMWIGIMLLSAMKQGWLLAKNQPVKKYAT